MRCLLNKPGPKVSGLVLKKVSEKVWLKQIRRGGGLNIIDNNNV